MKTFKFLFFLEQGCQQKIQFSRAIRTDCPISHQNTSNVEFDHHLTKTRRKTNETISKLKELMINKEKDKTDDTKDN